MDYEVLSTVVCQLLQLLGVPYLNLILTQMQHALTEGNQLFVLAYTLPDLLTAVKSSVHLQPSKVITVQVSATPFLYSRIWLTEASALRKRQT